MRGKKETAKQRRIIRKISTWKKWDNKVKLSLGETELKTGRSCRRN